LLDEKLMNFFEIQKTLDSKAHLLAIEAAESEARSAAERVLAIEKDSELARTTAASAWELQQADILDQWREMESSSRASRLAVEAILAAEKGSILAQSALGPVWKLQQADILAQDLRLRREMDLAREVKENFEERFRLPDIAETARMLAEFKESSFSEIFAQHAGLEDNLKQAMASMRTPWLDSYAAMPSIAGLAHVQSIGHALHSLPAFDEQLSATLRQSLGDWRDPIAWRPEIFTDLTARSDFYTSLGFDPAMTAFPIPAFEQALDIAGLPDEPLPVDGGFKPSQRDAVDKEEQGLMRTNAAHDRLQRLERQLRGFVNERMSAFFGANWPKHRLPNGLLDKWREKKQAAEQMGAEERELIDYADFTDYEAVICRLDNWREVFAPFFIRRESVRESFQRLHPIRLDTMHARLVTQDDELLLRVEIMRLVKAIKRRQI
jgi:hypothetical protein